MISVPRSASRASRAEHVQREPLVIAGRGFARRSCKSFWETQPARFWVASKMDPWKFYHLPSGGLRTDVETWEVVPRTFSGWCRAGRKQSVGNTPGCLGPSGYKPSGSCKAGCQALCFYMQLAAVELTKGSLTRRRAHGDVRL